MLWLINKNITATEKQMNINVIDYRGDSTVINSRGDSLYNYRTRYFHRIQEDFQRWQQHGHRFVCYTQHKSNIVIDDYWAFDRVVETGRLPVHQARNRVLQDIPYGEYTAIWDNDATLYWDRLRSSELPQDLNQVCEQAQQQEIVSFVPFNSQQSPYPKNLDCTQWTFKPLIHQKGTMLFVQNIGIDWPTHLTCLEDTARAIELTRKGFKTAQLQQASLNELVHSKSTVFKVNAYHEEYKKPGPRANPKGLLQWDAQSDRRDRYSVAQQHIESDYNTTIKELQQEQKQLW